MDQTAQPTPNLRKSGTNSWVLVCIVYLRFYYAMRKQGISRDRLPWKAPLQPYVAWIGVFAFILLLLTGGYTTFIHNQ